ncbi:XK-related protein 6-like isoform X2 [Dreissena polymorpha]|uniref:XK-related protein 6-like isoform X2 n=1 Tax=Dreissena polymorpha TaxID=45954 RepID=UPI0022654060|nr:XK-related protein 6-like isoform X2 [Dreissena polymorpha]
MASKKKLPRSRRCRDNEKLGIYTALASDQADCTSRNSAQLRYSLGNDSYVGRALALHSEDLDSVSATRELPPHKHVEQAIHQAPEFTVFDIILGFSSIGFFFFDVVTDMLLARDYFYQLRLVPFGLTTAFIVVPSFVTAALNLRWYFLDFQSQKILISKHGKEQVHTTRGLLWLVRIVMTCFMMGPVIRQIEYLYNGIKSRDKNLSEAVRKRHYTFMRCEDVDASCIRMFECFLEAAPQLLLQIYILMEYREEEVTWLISGIRVVSMLSSWSSLAISMVSYHKALRFSHEDRGNMSIPGSILYFLWRAVEIGPRVIALGMFASQFKWGVFIVVGVHWIAMSSWLICQKTQFYQNRCEEKCFNFVCGYVLVFCFLNVRDGRTRYRMILYYFIFYIENWLMLGFWFYFTDAKSQWFYLPTLFVVSMTDRLSTLPIKVEEYSSGLEYN